MEEINNNNIKSKTQKTNAEGTVEHTKYSLLKFLD